MERLNYEKILFENLSEGAFAMITKSEKDFADWIESIEYQSKRCDELYSKLKKYEDAEEKGLLLRLPCKVGDTVFFVGNEFINDYEIRRYIVDESGITVIQIAKEIDGKDYWNSFSIDDIGKSIFFTYQEAELELANRQQSHAEAIMDERNGR